MENPDFLWKQRFENYKKAILHLEGALQISSPDIIQKAGIIQFFEMCFELSWNLIKDYLEAQGLTDLKTPRSAFKKAFEVGLIDQGHNWMDLLLDRNLTAHTYDEDKANEVEGLIRNKYFPLMKNLYDRFEKKYDSE